MPDHDRRMGPARPTKIAKIDRARIADAQHLAQSTLVELQHQQRSPATAHTPSLALLTDLFQQTMAFGYWKLGHSEQEAVFHLFFRQTPSAGGYAIVAGLGPAVEFLETRRLDDSDVEYLATPTGNDGKPLFENGFLDDLQALRLTCDIDAMPEGRSPSPSSPS